MFVMHRRVVEGSGVGSAGFVMHVDVHVDLLESELCCGLLQSNCY